MFKFEKLEIWKESIHFSKKIYKITFSFPRSEQFTLSDQFRRSSSSIPANIAEGSGSSSKKDFSRYLDIAVKSIFETISHLYLAKELNYISEMSLKDLYNDAEILVKRINSFKKWLMESDHK